MLKYGELVVQSAGGICCVCKQRIQPGPAVQVSCKGSAIRHEECIPQDTKYKGIFYHKKVRKGILDWE